MAQQFKRFQKDPDAVLDYATDWAALRNGSGIEDWLVGEDAVETAEVTVTPDEGVTVNSVGINEDGSIVTAWLGGGEVGEYYKVTFRVTTTLGRTEDSTIIIECIQK